MTLTCAQIAMSPGPCINLLISAENKAKEECIAETFQQSYITPSILLHLQSSEETHTTEINYDVTNRELLAVKISIGNMGTLAGGN